MPSAALIIDIGYYNFELQASEQRRLRLSHVIKAIEQLAGVTVHHDYRYGFTATKDGQGNAFTKAIGLRENGGIKVKVCGQLKLVDGRHRQPHSVDIAISKCIEENTQKVRRM